MRDPKAGSQTLRLRRHQSRESVFIPVDEVLVRRLAFNNFLAIARGFSFEFEVFDYVLGRLGDDPAAVVEAFAASAASDLVEIARAEDGSLFAIILAQAREEDGSDGHVDADADGIGPANNFEQSFLSELLDQHAILGQQAGVVEANAMLEPLADFRPVRTGELETFERAAERVFLFARADV